MSSDRTPAWDTRLRTRYRIPPDQIFALGGFLLKYKLSNENVRIEPRQIHWTLRFRRRCKVYIITGDGFIRRWSLSQRRLKYYPHNEVMNESNRLGSSSPQSDELFRYLQDLKRSTA